jgi:tetratricopeptide (TPR) repeat protein
MMDHPSIAKVLEAGTTGANRPYFVMELVKGIPITKYCDQEHLTPKERLELFIPVCQAVQHAHQKGIIHRDLKPSNVLIALYDGKPVPKVIDFGVAKATAQKLTERTMFTEVGQIVGTVEYMAPEQAELNNLDIDTRADIYSLGVLLYELLTGSPPFTAKQLRSAAFGEMLRIIREVEPRRPSTKLSSSAELPSIAANRKLEPKKLTRLVHGDLDWIVMKCLEKERARRYETANGLAMEIQRFLADEPVAAGPPSARYRLGKFMRRNRRSVIAAGFVLAALLIGLGGTIWGLVEARAQRDRALRAEEEAHVQERQARANFELARGAVEEYGTKVSADPRLKEKDLEDLRKALLQSAVQFHMRFVEQYAGDPALRADLGRAYLEMSKIVATTEEMTRAIELTQQAIAVYESLIAEHPENHSYPLQLADALVNRGRWLDYTAQTDASQVAFVRALQMLESARQSHGASPQILWQYVRTCTNFAYLLHNKVGSPEQALAVCRKAIVFLERDRPGGNADDDAVMFEAELYSELADNLRETDQTREGLIWANKAVTLLLTRITATHRPRTLLYSLSQSYESLGRVHEKLSQLELACEAFRKSVEIDTELVASYPSDARYLNVLGIDYNSLCHALFQGGQQQEGLIALKKAVEAKEQLVARHAGVPDYEANLARSLQNLAQHTTDLDSAIKLQQRSQTLLNDLVDRYPKVAQYQISQAQSHQIRGLLEMKGNRDQEANAAIDQAIKLQETLVKTVNSAEVRDNLSRTYSLKADLCRRANEPDRAIEWYRKIAGVAPTEPHAHYDLGTALMNIGRSEEARAALEKAIALKPDFAEAHCNLGQCLLKLGRFAEGRTALQRGHELGSKKPKWPYHSDEWLRDADVLINLDGRLSAILQGKDQPADSDERLALAKMCFRNKQLYATAARFYSEAFGSHEEVANDLTKPHRYYAACAAALAGCGQGQDAGSLSTDERARLRQQALIWLRGELDAWTKLAESQLGGNRQRARVAFKHWQADALLACVRDAAALAKLPAAERQSWEALWTEVASALANTSKPSLK